jgi:hypothetical protein
MMKLGLAAMDEEDASIPSPRSEPGTKVPGDQPKSPLENPRHSRGGLGADSPGSVDPSIAPTPAEAEAMNRAGLEPIAGVPKEPYCAPGIGSSSGTGNPAGGRGDFAATRGASHSLSPTDRIVGATAAGMPASSNKPLQPLSRTQRIVMGERGAKLLAKVSVDREKVALELIDSASVLDDRKDFMEDRAVALVHGLLLHLDKHYRDLGFGAWMPFRWPDQWLSFCGLLSRVLAANGLIHAKHADTYRRLLDETPPVELKGTVKDRVKESRTPNNIAKCKSNQGAYTMSELKTRLQTEIWGPRDEFAQQWEEYWESQMKIWGHPPPE